jgi:hypothetical protein
MTANETRDRLVPDDAVGAGAISMASKPAEPPRPEAGTRDSVASETEPARATAVTAPHAPPPPTDPDPQLLAHVERALADLRLLASFVASTPDRRFVEGDTRLIQQADQFGETGNRLAGFYERVARTAGLSAAAIAASPERCAELFFLLDGLSRISYPASPDSIRLTSAYLEHPLEVTSTGEVTGLARPAKLEAEALRDSLRYNRWIMIGVFVLAIGLSIYTLFGQVLIGERDRIFTQIRQETHGFYTQARLGMRAETFRIADLNNIFLVNPEEMRSWITQICPNIRMKLPSPLPLADRLPPADATVEEIRIYPNADFMRSCDEFEYLEAQRRQADRAVSDWVKLALGGPEWALGGLRSLLNGGGKANGSDAAGSAPDATATSNGAATPANTPAQRNYSFKPWGETVVTAMGSYILPILFGVIGAWAAGERELRRKLERFEVTRTDRHTYRRGLLLGGVVGGVVGLFFSTDTLQNLSLTYSAIALLGGFAGDRVFRFMDDLINRVFSINRPQPGATAAATK